MARWMVGIDTGGTFTDLVASNVADQTLLTVKVPSAPADPAQAVVDGLRALRDKGVEPGDVAYLCHGTTVGTNALLEGRGARTGLLVNEGFRAVYEARGWRQPSRDELLDPFYRKPSMLAPQRRTFPIGGRISAEGTEVTPLDEAAVRAAGRALRQRGVESIAVCFLFSFLDDQHERRTAEILADEHPAARVSLSAQVLPVIREYPRLSTTVVDAYVGPVVEGYLRRVAGALDDFGVHTRQVFLMQSNGGLMRIKIGAGFPNQTLLSGPAAGVMAAIELGARMGRENLVTFDMGGTSTDICVIRSGHIDETRDGVIAGQDVGTPMLDIETLGAGGGTIAAVGEDGLLKVGPRSAGADPGPACYGFGGREPTVTDANLVLGNLRAGRIADGQLTLDPEAATAAIDAVIARPLGLSSEAAAAGILTVVINNMAVDLRLTLQKRGLDPRRVALVAFGGAGPLHAARTARAVGIPTVVVPRYPGLNSALGLLQTNVRHTYLRSAVGLLSQYDAARLNGHFADLERQAAADLAQEGFQPEEATLSRALDVRYLHQGYELTIPCAAPLDEVAKSALKTAFDSRHQSVYGISAPDEDAEVVSLRLMVEVPTTRARLPELPERRSNADGALVGTRRIYDPDTCHSISADVYERELLAAGDCLGGPALVEQGDSTTLVPAGASARVERQGDLIIEMGGRS